MNKNHFFISYAGNKRTEVKEILKNINLEQYTTIIEPYCGSASLSYYISTLYPNKFKYILNDKNKHLIDIMKLIKDKKTNDFEKTINELIININKEKYMELIKENTKEGYFIKNKIKGRHPGQFPTAYKSKYLSLECPFINFLQNEDVSLLNDDGINIVKNYNKKECLIFLDPPYLISYNSYYDGISTDINIYQYILDNGLNNFNSFILMCLENSWIINHLFKYYIKYKYKKIYSNRKRQTEHCIITNTL